ncbi:hypothetical protein VTN77DRAFT_3479 [Rasamsonia byssochlamydoides]|uniref:uncharacterized protein n=1 Tax=Rasamsonia byssochlamydoides TaxID=89139 RepID=UPI0037432E12
MSAAFTSSFVNKTNPDPYQQIIVLSQAMINDAFKNMWLIADDDSPIRHFKRKTRSGSIDVTLGQPRVQLQVTTVDPQLYFMLSMTSGSLHLYVSDDPEDDSTKDWEIDNWVFAFSVKIAQKILKKSDLGYKDYMSRTGLPEGDFSLAQLHIDSSSTTKYEPSLSSFGNEDWSKETAEARASFDDFISKWLLAMSEKGCNILGISMQANRSQDSGSYVPTFPPTSIDYYTYPWKDPSQSSPRTTENLDKNALCYLMMSDFAEPPSPVGWLLPLLQTINNDTEVIPTTPYIYYDSSKSSHPWSANTQGTQSTWTWTGYELSSENTVYGGGSSFTAQQKSTNTTKLSYAEGQETVSLSGTNVFTYYCGFDNYRSWCRITITSNWQFNMALTEIHDGGVVFALVDNADASQFSNAIDGSLENSTETIRHTLVDALQDKHKLFLPAKGTFLMKDPMFNARGDLMVQLAYDGADPPDTQSSAIKSSATWKAAMSDHLVAKEATRRLLAGRKARPPKRTMLATRARRNEPREITIPVLIQEA